MTPAEAKAKRDKAWAVYQAAKVAYRKAETEYQNAQREEVKQ